jgi:putative PEP-CTERM system histidine kinase
VSSAVFIRLAAAILATSAGARALIRKEPSVASVSFGVGMLLLAVKSVLGSIAVSDELSAMDFEQWGLSVLSLEIPVWLVFAVTYTRPSGVAALRGSGWMLLGFTGAAIVAGWVFREHLVLKLTGHQIQLGAAGRAVHVFLIIVATLVLMNLERAFRASAGVTRWQLKYLTVGVATLCLTRIYVSTQSVVYRVTHESMGIVNACALIIAALMAHVSFARGKPFSIALYPESKPAYRSVALVLIGAYLLSVGVIANAAALFGWATFPAIAFLVMIVIVAAGMAALSDHVRLRLKRLLSRTFQRPMYDFRKVWTAYNAQTVTQPDDIGLARSTVKIISETFDMLSVTTWLVRPGGIIAFGASTSLSEADAERLLETHAPKENVFDELRQNRKAIALEAAKETWAESLRALHPMQFKHGGQRFCIPVIAGNDLLALLMVGDRVGNVRTSTEESDLLTCIADQFGRDLARVQLANRLAEGKELRAFQTVATFFVHDLKNTASTLSLMLENLRVHFERPEFREDATRSLGKSVDRINDIVSRLGALRHEFKLNRAPADLNGVVTSTLDQFGTPKGGKVTTNLRPLPLVPLDAEQMQKVILNLLLNAKEALDGDGVISVETEQRDATALLVVSDNGVGMSPEFIRTRLFRPFQTTKAKGIGIGMFQIKTIVEGHNGKIAVESAIGKGTRFTVSLPVNGGDV